MTDRELLDMMQSPAQRNAGVSEFIRQFQKPVYYYIRRMVLSHEDADDLTQMVFIKAWKGLDGFRGDSKLSTWLFGIAMNMVRNYMRKMIEQDLYELPVLSFQELTQEINIQPLARVEL
jgi:RNA polymerase sigma-70 factor (ECF subfamily)